MARRKPFSPQDLQDQVEGVYTSRGLDYTIGESLAMLSIGLDPRVDTGPLYALVYKIFKDGRLPEEHEWTQICDLVVESPLYKPSRVDLKASQQATERLMEYMYPKRKAVELSGGLEAASAPVLSISKGEAQELDNELEERF